MKFILKIILCGIFLYLGQIIIMHFFPYPSPEAVQLIQSHKKNHKDIIFFGDSTLFFTSKKDVNKETTGDMLDKTLNKKYNVGMVAYAAWNPSLFYAYGKYMREQSYAPSYIIVPINLHSFSISYDLRPIYQFTDDHTYLEYYNTPLFPFVDFINSLTAADVNQRYEYLYKNAKVYDGDTYLGRAETFVNMSPNLPYEVRFKKIIEFLYMAPLDKNHRALLSLVALQKLYKNTNTKLIFYLTPIDYQTGEKYFGKRFSERIKSNTGLIVSRLREEDATVIDLSMKLQTDNFIWQENEGFYRYINEHINHEGKQYIVDQLIKSMEPKSY